MTDHSNHPQRLREEVAKPKWWDKREHELEDEIARLREDLTHADEAYARVTKERDRLGEALFGVFQLLTDDEQVNSPEGIAARNALQETS